jgi:hypothetical protein
MSTTTVTTEAAASVAANKVVSLHQAHPMAHEEQMQNTDQGNLIVAKGRPKKNLLPASDLAKVPVKSSTVLEEHTAFLEQQLKPALGKIQEELSKLAKVISGTDQKAPSAAPQDSNNTIDSWNQSILMLYTSFAVNQMNQNGLVMNGWQAQQQAQNQTLEAAAAAESANANANATNSNTPSVWKLLLIGLGVLVGVALFVCAPLAVAGIIGFAAGAAIAAGSAAAVGLSCWGAATSNPNAPSNAGLVENQPDSAKLQLMSALNQFWSTIAQKTNNYISSGSQVDLANTSSNDTALGQQASQVLQALVLMMKTQVAA